LLVPRFIVVCLAALALGACALSPGKVRQVDARVTAQREVALSCLPQTAGRCAIASPVLELGDADVRQGKHHVTLVEYGEDALKLRVHLIRAARRSIDMQNFILRKDDSGELVLNELLEAARRGVRVRLLLDQMFSVSDAD